MSLIGAAPWLSATLGPVIDTRVPLGALVHEQWRGGVFSRYDILLRSLVARQLLSDSPPKRKTAEMGWYQTMQQKRAGKDTLPAFKQLTERVRGIGLDPAYPIGISPRGSLLDGAHRTALAIAFGEETVAVDIRLGKRLRSFERRWFAERGFPDKALAAMDDELDRAMAESGVECVLVTPAGKGTAKSWLAPLLPAGVKVRREWTVSLSEADTVALEGILRWIPWHRKSDQAKQPARQLREGALEVIRLRLTHRDFERIRKTSTARDKVVIEFENTIRQETGRPVVIGQTYQQNRDALDFLRAHGWTHQAGESWL